MKEIKFRPLRKLKNGKICVASYAQWRKIKVADYEPFKLIIDTSYRSMDADKYVYNHKLENLFFSNLKPNDIRVAKKSNDINNYKNWKCGKMYFVDGLDVDGVPVFTNGTSLNLSVFPIEKIEDYIPLTVRVVNLWFGWFLYQLENVELEFLGKKMKNMSTKSSLFLTKDDEHCYEETSEPKYNADGKFLGNTIYLEMDKRNMEVDTDCDEYIILKIPPGSELYDLVRMMKN